MTKEEIDRLMKIGLGVIIFAFGLALAYFAADAMTQYKGDFLYGLILLGFGISYVLVGIAVASIFPVSLGLLFAADILILHVFSESFTGFFSAIKALIVVAAIVSLYIVALTQFKEVVPEKTTPEPNQKLS